VLCSSKDYLRTRTCDLNHPVLSGAKNTNSWHASKGDLQRAIPLNVLMVPSYSLAIASDGEHQTCGGFSLGETIHFGSLKFIADYFGGLSFSPQRDISKATAMGLTHSRPTSQVHAMIRDSTEEFHMASDGEGGRPPLS
jgi:hypothetical protein